MKAQERRGCEDQSEVGNVLSIAEYACLLDPDRYGLHYDSDTRSFWITIAEGEKWVAAYSVKVQIVMQWRRPSRVFHSVVERLVAERESSRS